jgi:outer membrane protein assembly factor BamB
LFYAFNPDGTTKWTFTAPVAGEGIYTAAAIDAAGNLYIGTLSGNFYSIDPTGKLRWTCATGDSITSAPALANGAAYFGDYDANLYSVSTSNGAVNWKYPLGAQVRASAPAVDANGTVYIGSYDHNVYAVSGGGSLVRVYATDDVVRSSPVISGTSLYFASEDHKVYAFNLGASAAGSDWPMYQFNAQRIGRNAAASLSITAQPASQTVAPGLPVTLSVGATGPGALSYQWSFNGAPIAGATNSTYFIAAATTADGGSYSVTVTGSSGSITSAGAVLTVGVTVVGPPTGASGRIVNLSARANVGTGSNILIAGFTIQGTGSKTVVLRGVGPTLAAAPFNVSGALATPELTLLNAATDATIVTGTAWGGSAALAVAFAQVSAFALPANSLDAAVEQTLAVGGYTSQITGTGGSTGIALAEIYDADAAGTETTSLTNISARANVGTGANILIAGFVIGGSQPVQVLLRGVGPSLGAPPFSVPGVLAQPEIDLYDSTQTKIQTNTGWAGSAVLASIFAESGAFALQNGSADAAMVMTLSPGSYTLQLSGQNGSTGVGLVEVYLVP